MFHPRFKISGKPDGSRPRTGFWTLSITVHNKTVWFPGNRTKIDHLPGSAKPARSSYFFSSKNRTIKQNSDKNSSFSPKIRSRLLVSAQDDFQAKSQIFRRVLASFGSQTSKFSFFPARITRSSSIPVRFR